MGLSAFGGPWSWGMERKPKKRLTPHLQVASYLP